MLLLRSCGNFRSWVPPGRGGLVEGRPWGFQIGPASVYTMISRNARKMCNKVLPPGPATMAKAGPSYHTFLHDGFHSFKLWTQINLSLLVIATKEVTQPITTRSGVVLTIELCKFIGMFTAICSLGFPIGLWKGCLKVWSWRLDEAFKCGSSPEDQKANKNTNSKSLAHEVQAGNKDSLELDIGPLILCFRK